MDIRTHVGRAVEMRFKQRARTGRASEQASDAQSRKRACARGWLTLVLSLAASCAAASPPPEGVTSDAQTLRFTLSAAASSARELASSLRSLTGYPADPGSCGDVMLGPLPEGLYTGEEAWLALIEPVCPVIKRRNARTHVMEVLADMRRCTCRFGLPARELPPSAQVVVTASPLPTLVESVPSEVVLMTRQRIEETGAASIPDLLRYLSQTAFYRGPGYRTSGAQYAELRGLGADYTLVLINGRRAFGTAADFASSAFDLSVIPMSAVERVEISFDANSLVHGMDAIGGIVNVVLNDDVTPRTEVRYGGVRGGGSRDHVSVSGGKQGERARIAAFFDVERRDELLGRARDRWRNQDFRRFGGLDYRSRYAWPPNIRTVDGQPLPGLGDASAAAELDTDSGTVDFIEGRENLTSLSAFQAIVPQRRRATLSVQGSARVGSARASVEWLSMRRAQELQSYPSIIPGYIMSPSHPDNPFGVPISVDAALAGWPAQRAHVASASNRVVAGLDGPLGRWRYGAFVVRSDEQANARVRNVTDDVAVARALQAEEPYAALSLYSTLRRGGGLERLLVDAPTDRYSAYATQLHASLAGAPMRLPAGEVTLNVGLEHRREHVRFDALVHGASRDITSVFGQVRLPLIESRMRVPGIEDLNLTLGARRDDYSDIGAVTKAQVGVVWHMTPSITWRASRSETFRPPSLAELNVPRVVIPTVMFDGRRGETSTMELRMGGNPQLRPTAGHSSSLSVSFHPSDRWRMSAEYWWIKVQGHVVVLAPMSLLAHEDLAAQGQVIRASPTLDDTLNGRPGSLVMLDISRQNVGGATTKGWDLSMETAIDTQVGTFTPSLSVSLTDNFLYSELPNAQAPMEERVGVASEFGSIPAARAVASLLYDREGWRASIHARVISSYRDRSAVSGELMQRRVPTGAMWDVNVSKVLGERFRFTLGAFNVTDRAPPFAHIGGSLGFDPSQGDLEGRELYVRIRGEF